MNFIFKALSLFLFLTSYTSLCQENKIQNILDKLNGSYDDHFIQKVQKDFSFTLNSKNWMDVYKLKVENESLNFRSNLSYNFGASVGYKMLQIGYTFNLNRLLSSKGKLNRNEWNFSLSNNIVSLELYHYNNRGESNLLSFNNDISSRELNIAYDGLQSKIYGADLYYFTNHKKFLNTYTNRPNYRQLKSQGSLILGFSFSYESMYFDFNKLPNDESLENFITLNKQTYNYTSYNLSLGYAYNLVFAKSWLVNLSVIPSLGASVDSRQNKKPGYLSLKNKIRLSLIQDVNNSFWGVKCQYNSHWYYSENNSVTNSIANFNIVYGMRF